MAEGIKDKVAIIGMGCTKFGERFDASPQDLMVEAFVECLADSGLEKKDIQAAWWGVPHARYQCWPRRYNPRDHLKVAFYPHNQGGEFLCHRF